MTWILSKKKLVNTQLHFLYFDWKIEIAVLWCDGDACDKKSELKRKWR